MPAACRSSCRAASSASWSIAACRRTNRETWRQVARATAAHSTVMFNDTSSCRFLETGSFKRLIGTPIVSGPTNVPVAREERGDAIVLRASHDGYADRFSVIHQRALMLAPDGNRLDGEDLFVASDGDVHADRTCPTSSRCASTCIPRSRPTG